VVERDGGPLGVTIAGANVHPEGRDIGRSGRPGDTKLLAETLDSIVVERPKPTKEAPQNLCLDKGYDNPTGREATESRSYVPHIRRIGEEKLDEKRRKRRPARRWVVERMLSGLQKCRAILVRYDKEPRNYLGLIQLACALLWFRRLHRLADMRF
jgi:putative transposase